MRAWLFVLSIPVLLFTSCKQHEARIFTSDCANEVHYKVISYRHLLDSLNVYNHKYVQVQGRYQQGKYLSVLVSDSTFTDHDAKHAFWINFTPDCPLLDAKTHTGLFQAETGEYQTFNDKEMLVRGRLELHQATANSPYVAVLNEIVYVELR